MTVQEMARRSGYSRQRLNKLVDMGWVRGVRRKPSGRLEVLDEKILARWCDRLRMRMTQRHQRNLERIEWRDRLKVRRQIIEGGKLWPSVLPVMTREIANELADKIRELAETDGKDFSDGIVNGFAEDKARQFADRMIQPIGFQKGTFVLKGRNASTRAARHALFDFEVYPELTPFKSWAEIARAFGCTRSALSAAAKQLPPALRKRRYRFRT